MINYFYPFFLFIFILILYYTIKQIQSIDYTFSKSIKNYLFIFNFHWIKYDCFDFINDVYIPYIKRTFHHKCSFVFYGPNKSDKYPIKSNGLKEAGHYSYYTIVKAFYDENTVYDGYFLLNDDSFFDPVVFYKSKYNLTKPIIEGIVLEEKSLEKWFWPGVINYRGITFRQAYLNFRENVCEKKSFYGSKYSKSRLCHFNIKVNICGYADFIYIPNEYIRDYVHLLDLAYREGMFLEIALNTVAYMFEYIELGKKCYSVNELGNCPHIHPVKYSYNANREKISIYINQTFSLNQR